MKKQDIEDLRELIEFLKQHQVAEFDVDRGDLKIRLKFNPPGERLRRAERPGAAAEDGAGGSGADSAGCCATGIGSAGAGRTRRPRGRVALGEVADCGHVLWLAVAGRLALCFSRRSRGERPGDLRRRGHEADERDRVRRRGRSCKVPCYKRPAHRVWPAVVFDSDGLGYSRAKQALPAELAALVSKILLGPEIFPNSANPAYTANSTCKGHACFVKFWLPIVAKSRCAY